MPSAVRDQKIGLEDQGGLYGTGNRITSFAGCGYTTDADGNVTGRTNCGGLTATFKWTAESRLDTGLVAEYSKHALYRALQHDDPDAAHSRYNALIRRRVSFERALACAR